MQPYLPIAVALPGTGIWDCNVGSLNGQFRSNNSFHRRRFFTLVVLYEFAAKPILQLSLSDDCKFSPVDVCRAGNLTFATSQATGHVGSFSGTTFRGIIMLLVFYWRRSLCQNGNWLCKRVFVSCRVKLDLQVLHFFIFCCDNETYSWQWWWLNW